MFENVREKNNPIGVELIKKGLLTQSQVERVLDYQKNHRDMKFAEIVDVLDMCDKTELLNALASPKTNWDTIIPVEYIRECEAYTTPETADKEYMLLKKVKNSFNKRDSKTISLATSEQVYSILDAVKAVVTGEMETPVMNQSGYIANCFRNTFRL